MKRLVFLVVAIFSPALYGQSTAVSALVSDAASTNWSSGPYTITFVPVPGNPGPYFWNGSQFAPQAYTGNLDAGGNLAITLPSSTAITPAKTKWQFTVCPLASSPCYTQQISITGTTQNITSQLTPLAVGFFATPFQFGYNDSEVNVTPGQGQVYYNVGSAATRQWTGSAWQNLGGGGTVTHTTGALTANQMIVGNGGADVKPDTGCSTDGAGNLSCGTVTTAVVTVTGINGPTGAALTVYGALGQSYYFGSYNVAGTYLWAADAAGNLRPAGSNITGALGTSSNPVKGGIYAGGTGAFHVDPSGNSTAPKTNGVWHITANGQDVYPIWQSALAAITSTSTPQTIVLDPGVYAVASAQLLNDSDYCINVIGSGDGRANTISYTGTTLAGGIIARDASASSVVGGCVLQGFTVSGGTGIAAAYGLDLSFGYQWRIQDVNCQDVSSECFRIGMNGTFYENHLEHLRASGNGPGAYAFGTVTVASGAATSTTISVAGSGYTNPVVYLWGGRFFGSFSQYCQTLGPFSTYTLGAQPTGTAVLNGSGGVASVTLNTPGSNCLSGGVTTSVQMQIANLAPGTFDQWGNTVALGTANSGAAYGYHFGTYFTDSDSYDLVDSDFGILAGIKIEGTDNRFRGLHPYFVAEGIVSYGSNTFDATECDSMFRDCFVEMGNNDSITNTQFYYHNSVGYGPTSFPGSSFAWVTSPAGNNLRYLGSQCEDGDSTWQALYVGLDPGYTGLNNASYLSFYQANNEFLGLGDCRQVSSIADLNNVFGHGAYSFGLPMPVTKTWNARVNVAPYSIAGDGLSFIMPSASYTGDYFGGWVDSASPTVKAFGMTYKANMYLSSWQLNNNSAQTQPTCSATGGPGGTSSEGTGWYIKGTGSTNGVLQLCQNQSGTYTWVTAGSSSSATASIVATLKLTGQTAALAGPITLYTPAAAGTYRISASLYLTAVGTAGSITSTFGFNTGAGGSNQYTYGTPALSTTTLGAAAEVVYTEHIGAGTNITYGTSFSGVTGSPTYGYDVVVEQLQ